VDLRVEPVTPGGANPIGIRDALTISRLTRAAPAAVVLQAAVHVVEGLTHIRRDRVVLRDRKVGNEIDGAATVVTDVNTADATDEEKIRIGRIDPHRVMIRVRTASGVAKSVTAISRYLQGHTHEVNAIGIGRVDANLTHVPRIRERGTWVRFASTR